MARMLSLAQRLRALDDTAAASIALTSQHLRLWRQRPTMRQQLREAREPHGSWLGRDAAANDETRLAASQRVGCVGLMLLEAVTPSTLADFERARARLPIERRDLGGDANEDKSRTRGGGWTSLGYMRPPGKWMMGSPGSGHDPTLPDFVDAVHLTLHHVLASVDMLVATFVLTDDAGDLSPSLQADYRSFNDNIRMKASGVARLTRHIPWARPRVGIGYSLVDACEAKARALDTRLDDITTKCRAWLAESLPGRFALEPKGDRPGVTMLVTDGITPYSESALPLRPLGFRAPRFGVWTSPDAPGWSGSFPRGMSRRRSRTTWIARRDELPGRRDSRSDEEARQNWVVGHRFHEEHGPLFALWGLWRLLLMYETALARYRDAAGASARRRAKPMKQARALDRLLTTDAMDAATVCQDIIRDLPDPNYLRIRAPEYVEISDFRPQNPQPRLLAGLHANLHGIATEFPQRSEVVLAHARVSAELRQAMSNTRLQRVILSISAAALVVAAIGLVNSGSSDGATRDPRPSLSPSTTPAPATPPPTSQGGH